jgi:hypothetical protein
MDIYHPKRVESVILEMHRKRNMTFVYTHVKSHQDDKTETANLLLESCLNVEANCLATKYMKEDLQRQPVVALFPSAKAQLIIRNASVTRKIPQSI